MTINIDYFMNGATDKESAKNILRALEECRLFRFLTYTYFGVNEVDVAKFYLNATNFEGEVIRSKVGGSDLEVVEQEIRECYNFPESRLIKKNMKIEYDMLIEMIYKFLDNKLGSLDDLSSPSILRKKGIRLRKQKNVGAYRVLLRRYGPDYGKKGSCNKPSEGGDSTSSRTPRSRRRNTIATSEASEFLASSNPIFGYQEAISTAMALVPFQAVIENPSEDVYRSNMLETHEIAGVEVEVSNELQRRISSQPLAKASDTEPTVFDSVSSHEDPELLEQLNRLVIFLMLLWKATTGIWLINVVHESANKDDSTHVETVDAERQTTNDECNLVDVNVEENIVDNEGENANENISDEGLFDVAVGRDQGDEIDDNNAEKSVDCEENINQAIIEKPVDIMAQIRDEVDLREDGEEVREEIEEVEKEKLKMGAGNN
nr:CTTNBP2 N-terminal-like protein [Ipomoea batatas]